MSSSDHEDDDRPIMAVDLDKTSMCNDREKVWADIGCVEGDPAMDCERFGTQTAPTILHPPKGARRFVSTASAANRRQSTEIWITLFSCTEGTGRDLPPLEDIVSRQATRSVG